MKRILVVEDDPALNKMLCLNLSVAGFDTCSVQTVGEAFLCADEYHPDLCILDVMLPDASGLELLTPLKAKGIPMIVASAKGDIETKLKGLTNGADDYIVKPFEIIELIARINIVLSHYGKTEEIIKINDVLVSLTERTVKRDGRDIPLTPMEFDLLAVLISNRNTALSREQLLERVWGFLYEGGTRTVDVHIAQLRKKTGLQIVSVPKIGYRLEV